jgi:inner membrane protein
MARNGLRSSVGARLVIVGLMTFILLIPAVMIRFLVYERQDRRDSVASEISGNWGGNQRVIGPVLNVPFRYVGYDEQGRAMESICYAHFLPAKLDITGAIDPEVRNRGIYKVIVYNSKLDLSAVFSRPRFGDLNVDPGDILWSDASVSLGISDMKGVKDPVDVNWNGGMIETNPGIPNNDVVSSGMTMPVDLSGNETEFTYQTKLNLNGSFGLRFSPMGKETNLHLSSTWRNPSFTGDYLPTEREVTDNGFQSDWRILYVSRDFPQQWIGSRYQVDKSLFGVSLLVPVDQYQKTMRTIKYSIMFFALTFLTFFVIEILGGRPIHPIQYLLIGLALLIFYTLLLSLSEYIPFGYAYLVASIAIVALITLYSTSFLSGKLRPMIVALVLVVLYGYLYVVLQLQDYALLMGSFILFVALALTMYLTRKIDWFSALSAKKTDG